MTQNAPRTSTCWRRCAPRSAGSVARWPGSVPTTWPPRSSGRVVERLPDLDPAAIDEVYLGDANQAGEDNRNVARMAVLLAGLPVTVPGATVNRLCGSGLEAVIDASRAVRRRRRRRRARRRRRVDEPCTVGAAQASKGLSDRARAAVEHDARLAHDQPAHAHGVDDLARRGRRGPGRQVLDQPRGAGRVRPRLPPAGGGGVGRGLVRRRDRARVGRRTWSATSASGPTPRWRSWPRCKPVFRAGGTVTAGNASPMNDGAAALVLASEAGVAAPGAAPLARVVSPRHQWRRAAPLRHRSGRGRPPGAGPSRSRLGRPLGRRAQRGLRRAEPGLPGRVARARPRHRQPARRRHRHRAPARAARAPGSSPPSSTTCGAPAAATAWPRCASGSARASPSSSRTPSEGVRNREREHHARCPPGRGPGHVLG